MKRKAYLLALLACGPSSSNLAATAEAVPISWSFAESIPTGMDVDGVAVSTAEAVLKLITGATTTIDMAVMYWSLLPESCGGNITSCDDAASCQDCSGFTSHEFDALGARQGYAVHQALVHAAERGVRIKILQSAGFTSEKQGGVPNSESAALAAAFPMTVQVATINMSAWYGDGIQHSKYIAADRSSFLLGSSNFMDWRSLTQVRSHAG